VPFSVLGLALLGFIWEKFSSGFQMIYKKEKSASQDAFIDARECALFKLKPV
jgi:hypothetical protein